jgi:hypothetical protein
VAIAKKRVPYRVNKIRHHAPQELLQLIETSPWSCAHCVRNVPLYTEVPRYLHYSQVPCSPWATGSPESGQVALRPLGGLLVGGGGGRDDGGSHGGLQSRVVLVHEDARRRKPEKLRSLNPRPVVGGEVGGEVGRLAGYLDRHGDSRRYHACENTQWTKGTEVKRGLEREGTKRSLQPEQRCPHPRFSSHIIERSPSRELETTLRHFKLITDNEIYGGEPGKLLNSLLSIR